MCHSVFELRNSLLRALPNTATRVTNPRTVRYMFNRRRGLEAFSRIFRAAIASLARTVK